MVNVVGNAPRTIERGDVWLELSFVEPEKVRALTLPHIADPGLLARR